MFVTVGVLTAEALAIAAKAVVDKGVGEAVKDAYQALKHKILPWAGADVDALERTPEAKGRQMVVAEQVDSRPPAELDEVKALADALVKALAAQRQAGPVGVDAGRIEALRVRLGEVDVTAGVGLRADEIKAEEFSLDRLKVGPSGGA